MTNLFPIPFPTAGAAIQALPIARSSGLRASYHPGGGEANAHVCKPVTHTLWIVGSWEQIAGFIKQIGAQEAIKETIGIQPI